MAKLLNQPRVAWIWHWHHWSSNNLLHTRPENVKEVLWETALKHALQLTKFLGMLVQRLLLGCWCTGCRNGRLRGRSRGGFFWRRGLIRTRRWNRGVFLVIWLIKKRLRMLLPVLVAHWIDYFPPFSAAICRDSSSASRFLKKYSHPGCPGW